MLGREIKKYISRWELRLGIPSWNKIGSKRQLEEVIEDQIFEWVESFWYIKWIIGKYYKVFMIVVNIIINQKEDYR